MLSDCLEEHNINSYLWKENGLPEVQNCVQTRAPVEKEQKPGNHASKAVSLASRRGTSLGEMHNPDALQLHILIIESPKSADKPQKSPNGVRDPVAQFLR
ncbi:hypothetical protein P7K49_027725 [Saguinus oedipus]|uniref:Uncharacterized protein n=1 Tax=Saguinus oedipus TaxID=9490 RepID=A0ABQ9UAB4_SAGOE|nr:hypothetical protein P7K49_027725 [Saguinus oedipus]